MCFVNGYCINVIGDFMLYVWCKFFDVYVVIGLVIVCEVLVYIVGLYVVEYDVWG